MITVKFYGTVKGAAGIAEVRLCLDEARLADILSTLGETCGPSLQAMLFDEENGLSRSIQVLVNGKHLPRDTAMSRSLIDGDILYIMPVVAGG